MTEGTSAGAAGRFHRRHGGRARPDRAAVPGRSRSWVPSWGLITTKHLELRKRRGLMVVTALLSSACPSWSWASG